MISRRDTFGLLSLLPFGLSYRAPGLRRLPVPYEILPAATFGSPEAALTAEQWHDLEVCAPPHETHEEWQAYQREVRDRDSIIARMPALESMGLVECLDIHGTNDSSWTLTSHGHAMLKWRDEFNEWRRSEQA
jgi:hypothetical protein